MNNFPNEHVTTPSTQTLIFSHIYTAHYITFTSLLSLFPIYLSSGYCDRALFLLLTCLYIYPIITSLFHSMHHFYVVIIIIIIIIIIIEFLCKHCTESLHDNWLTLLLFNTENCILLKRILFIHFHFIS